MQTYEDNKSRSAFDEIVLGRDIEWAAVVAVETHQLDLPGVSLRVRPRRNYADGPIAAHILGYMGEINQRQLKNYKEQGYLVGDEIGQSGLERRWEDVLRGQHGGQQVEVDALGRRVRVLHQVNDVPGYTVHLTLDRQMQQTAYEALDGQGRHHRCHRRQLGRDPCARQYAGFRSQCFCPRHQGQRMERPDQ